MTSKQFYGNSDLIFGLLSDLFFYCNIKRYTMLQYHYCLMSYGVFHVSVKAIMPGCTYKGI